MEWSQENKYNSFNSHAKSLTFYEHYNAINEWRVGKRKVPLPPLEISLDLINTCQLNCEHCNTSKYLTKQEISRVNDGDLLKLLDFFSEWGVRAICFGGGGESTLHTKIWDALQYSQFLGMQNSIATNGINFNKETIEIAVKTCRWIGVSVDASNKETYQIGRKGDYFDKVIENLKTMVEISNHNSSNICDIAFKFLIFSYNQHEIYDACKLAKGIGVKDFHVRPADFRHQGMEEWQEKQKFYDVELINKQFEECRKLEDKDFRVFCVTHKFNSDFTPRRNFSQCYASPICLQVNPNGNCFLCPDTRNLEMYKLGEYSVSVDKIKGFWGSKKHYDLVFNSGCKNCKSRCTFGYYNEDFENLFIKNYDPLCRNFV